MINNSIDYTIKNKTQSSYKITQAYTNDTTYFIGQNNIHGKIAYAAKAYFNHYFDTFSYNQSYPNPGANFSLKIPAFFTLLSNIEYIADENVSFLNFNNVANYAKLSQLYNKNYTERGVGDDSCFNSQRITTRSIVNLGQIIIPAGTYGTYVPGVGAAGGTTIATPNPTTLNITLLNGLNQISITGGTFSSGVGNSLPAALYTSQVVFDNNGNPTIQIPANQFATSDAVAAGQPVTGQVLQNFLIINYSCNVPDVDPFETTKIQTGAYSYVLPDVLPGPANYIYIAGDASGIPITIARTVRIGDVLGDTFFNTDKLLYQENIHYLNLQFNRSDDMYKIVNNYDYTTVLPKIYNGFGVNLDTGTVRISNFALTSFAETNDDIKKVIANDHFTLVYPDVITNVRTQVPLTYGLNYQVELISKSQGSTLLKHYVALFNSDAYLDSSMYNSSNINNGKWSSVDIILDANLYETIRADNNQDYILSKSLNTSNKQSIIDIKTYKNNGTLMIPFDSGNHMSWYDGTTIKGLKFDGTTKTMGMNWTTSNLGNLGQITYSNHSVVLKKMYIKKGIFSHIPFQN